MAAKALKVPEYRAVRFSNHTSGNVNSKPYISDILSHRLSLELFVSDAVPQMGKPYQGFFYNAFSFPRLTLNYHFPRDRVSYISLEVFPQPSASSSPAGRI